MKVNQYMELHDISEEEMCRRVGVAPKTLENQLSREIRPSWLERLGDVATPREDGTPADGRRRSERPPTPPPGAPRVPSDPEPVPADTQAIDINYSQLESWITKGYEMAAASLEGSDPPLAKVIRQNAAKAGAAWANYIRLNPRIAAFLQRMMVATPLGEVIAIHLGIGLGYFFARKQYQAEVERAAAEAVAGDGSERPDFGPIAADFAATS